LKLNRFSFFCDFPASVSPPDPNSPRCDSLHLSQWFVEEVQPHEPELRAYLRKSFPSLADIDDLVQETYARLVRARNAGGVSEARPYLFATARNTACDLFRRSRIVSITAIADIEGLSVVEDRPATGEALDRAKEIEILRQAIAALPPRCREVLTLCKLYGLSHREVAKQLGISEHTVHAQVALGVLRCRDFLRASGLLTERAP
jgi:RNA polymerase sigma-70 factor (ECF subfamily)